SDRNEREPRRHELGEIVVVHSSPEEKTTVGKAQSIVLVKELTASVDHRSAREHEKVAPQLFRLRLDSGQKWRVEVETLTRKRRLVCEHADDAVLRPHEPPGRRVRHVGGFTDD